MKLANLTLLISNLYWNFKTFCEVVLHIWRLCYNMLCKKQSAIIIINNKQIHLLLKIWLRLHFGTHPSLKINSGTNPIFENRWYSGRCPLRHSGSCTPLTCGERWPESPFQTLILFQKFWNLWPDPVRKFLKFENPTPVQTPTKIINPTLIYPCFYLRNYLTDSCYCRNWKVNPDPGPFLPNFFYSRRSRLRQDSAFFFRLRIRTRNKKFGKNRSRIRSHFSISAVAGVCVDIS